MDDVQIRLTDDGSHTLYAPRVEECYHSQYGAVQESLHIFIGAGWRQCVKKELRILEIGFGTGLNAFLTLQEAAREGKKVTYTSLELYPVAPEVAGQLNYFERSSNFLEKDFLKLHTVAWNEKVGITPFFDLEKLQVDFTQVELKGMYDLFYFDAFSPEKQPEMWTQERFECLYRHANPGAVLTTYCAKGMVRRALQAAGFTVERLPGPPGKREILRATK